MTNNLKWKLGKFSGWLGIIEGIVTAWIPGFLMLLNVWPKN
ncbi:AmiS/UreI family transporter [Streptomyces brasiliscabiei]